MPDGTSSCPDMIDNITFDSSYTMNKDCFQAALRISMKTIDTENLLRLENEKEKQNRDHDESFSSESTLQIVSTLDYDHDALLSVLESLIKCPPLFALMCSGDHNLRAYCPFSENLEPYRHRNNISLQTGICKCKKGMTWLSMMNHLRQLAGNCMLHFAVYKFVKHYSQMITGKTNVKSQNCQANKLLSSPVPEVILTEPLSSISISSASNGKRKRVEKISDILVRDDHKLTTCYNISTGSAETPKIV